LNIIYRSANLKTIRSSWYISHALYRNQAQHENIDQ